MNQQVGAGRVTAGEPFDVAKSVQHDHNQGRRLQGVDVRSGTYRDADGRDDPDSRRARQTGHGAAGMQNRARPDEPDAGGDLRGDTGRVAVARTLEGQPHRHQREEHGADANQDVRPETGRLARELPLQPDRAPEQHGECQLKQDIEMEYGGEPRHHASPPRALRKPILRRTRSIVRRAMAPARSAPACNRSITVRGSARRAAPRSRMGVSAAIILSANTRLQSRQPQPAVRQLCATSLRVSGGEKPWWIVKMLQMSGFPGSLRVTRAGSVAAGLSFSQMVSGGSKRPIVLPRLLDIFA